MCLSKCPALHWRWWLSPLAGQQMHHAKEKGDAGVGLCAPIILTEQFDSKSSNDISLHSNQFDMITAQRLSNFTQPHDLHVPQPLKKSPCSPVLLRLTNGFKMRIGLWWCFISKATWWCLRHLITRFHLLGPQIWKFPAFSTSSYNHQAPPRPHQYPSTKPIPPSEPNRVHPR